jgi:hypothetical protein
MKNHTQPDVCLYRIDVAVLGITLVGSIFCTITLMMAGQSRPEVIVALGLLAIGGLAGLLTPSPQNR